MENKELTPVEWLIEQYTKKGYIGMQDELQAKQMEKEQIEISDEEIEKAIIDQDVVKQEGYCHCFLEGAKWYKEQLKKK